VASAAGLLLLGSLAVACGGRTGLQGSFEADGGLDLVTGGDALAPADVLFPADATAVDAPVGDGASSLLHPVAQGDPDQQVYDIDGGQVVFGTDRYAILWTENRAGQLFQRLAIVDLDGNVLRPARTLVPELGEAGDGQLVADATGFALFITAGLQSYFVPLDRDGADAGAPVPLPSGVTPAQGRALFVSPYYAVVWTDAPSTPDLDLVTLADDGSARSETVRLGMLNAAVPPVPVAIGHGATYGTYYAAPWVARGDPSTGVPDNLVLARFTEDGQLADDVKLLQISPTLHLGRDGVLARGDRAFVGIWDYGQGVRLYRTGGPPDWQALVPDLDGAPALAMDDEVAGVVATRGDPQPSTVPSELVLAGFAPDGQPVVSTPVTVNPGFADRGTCVEAYTVAPGPDGSFGVLWREGCGGPRTLYFRRAWPDPP
jgi:hypothetical protein